MGMAWKSEAPKFYDFRWIQQGTSSANAGFVQGTRFLACQVEGPILQRFRIVVQKRALRHNSSDLLELSDSMAAVSTCTLEGMSSTDI